MEFARCAKIRLDPSILPRATIETSIGGRRPRLEWPGRSEADVETANLESVIFGLFRMFKTLTASSPQHR
jgi:hypothetical protein